MEFCNILHVDFAIEAWVFFSFGNKYSSFRFSCNSTTKFDLYELKVIQEEKNVQNKAKKIDQRRKKRTRTKKANLTKRKEVQFHEEQRQLEKKTRPKPHKKLEHCQWNRMQKVSLDWFCVWPDQMKWIVAMIPNMNQRNKKSRFLDWANVPRFSRSPLSLIKATPVQSIRKPPCKPIHSILYFIAPRKKRAQ